VKDGYRSQSSLDLGWVAEIDCVVISMPTTPAPIECQTVICLKPELGIRDFQHGWPESDGSYAAFLTLPC